MQHRYPCRPGSSSHTASGCKCQPGKKSTPCKPGQSSVCCESTCPVLCGKLCKKDCGKVQVIELATGIIDPTADTVVLDRVDWKSKSTSNGVGFVNKCALYKLPKTGCEGQRILFYNHHNAISILQHPWPLGVDECGTAVPPNSPASNAEFWHVTLSHHDDVVELEWIDYNHGWTIIRQQGDIHVQSLRAVTPKYLYSLCTLRRMNGGYGSVPRVEPPNVPVDEETGEGLVRDFVSVVDLEPSSVNYGKIVYKAFGSIPFSSDDEKNLEYHHGDLLSIDGQHFVAAPSLNFSQSYLDFFALNSLQAPTLSGVITNNHAEMLASASALHTVHQNNQTSEIIISNLGDGTDIGPGGFVQVSPDVKTFTLENSYQKGPGPTAQTITQYQQLTGVDANGKEFSPFFAFSAADGISDTVKDEFQYDFTINECTNTLVCTSWGPPASFDAGFDTTKDYGRTIRVLQMPTEMDQKAHNDQGIPLNLTVQKVFATNWVDVEGGEGVVPLEVRRTHVPGDETYFVGITLPGAIDLVYKDGSQWKKEVIISPAQLVADCTNTLVTDAPSNVPLFGNLPVPLVTEITLSEDDRYLYVSCWLAGVLLQYDVSKPKEPRLVGGVGNLGGVTVINPYSNEFRADSYEFKTGVLYAGGPQMLRLDPAGKNLYVVNSLYSSWDDEFFPQDAVKGTKDGSLLTNGGMMIKLKTGVKQSGDPTAMSIDKTFGENGVIQYKDLEAQAFDGTKYITVPFTSRVHEGHMMGVRH